MDLLTYEEHKAIQAKKQPISPDPPPLPTHFIDSDMLKVLNKITLYAIWHISEQRRASLESLEKKKWIKDLERSGYKRIGSLLHVGMPKTAEALSSAILAKLDKPRQTNWRIIKWVSWITWADIDNLVRLREEAHEKIAASSVIDCTIDDATEPGGRPIQRYNTEEAQSSTEERQNSAEPRSPDLIKLNEKLEELEEQINNMRRPRGIRTPGNRFNETKDLRSNGTILFSDSEDAVSSEESASKSLRATKSTSRKETWDVLNNSRRGAKLKLVYSRRDATANKACRTSRQGNETQSSHLSLNGQEVDANEATEDIRRIQIVSLHSIPPVDTFNIKSQPLEPPKASNSQKIIATRTRARNIQTAHDINTKPSVTIPQKILGGFLAEHETLLHQVRKNTGACERIEKKLLRIEPILSRIAEMETGVQNIQEVLVSLLEFCKGRDI